MDNALDYSPINFVDASSVALEKLLSGPLLEVPSYQRDYAWGSKQIDALWSDLEELVQRSWDADAARAVLTPHFLGPLVFRKSADSHRPLEVVDGQQRLVTFSILISLLLDHVSSLPQESQAGWRQTLDNELVLMQDGERVPRLKLGSANSHFVEMFLKDRRTSEARSSYFDSRPKAERRAPEFVAMNECQRALSQKVSEYLAVFDPVHEPGKWTNRFVRLVRTINKLAIFLVIKVNEVSSAYEVFEGLNARGLDLSQADLIKSKAMEAIAHSAVELKKAEQLWVQIREHIESQSMLTLTEFLHFHYLVEFETIRSSDLYSKASQSVLKHGQSIAYLTGVRDAAVRLAEALECGNSLHSDAVPHIEAIRDQIQNKFALLFVIASTRRCNVESQDFADLVRLAHNFSFRAFVVGDHGLSSYSSIVSRLAREYSRGNKTLSDLSAEMKTESSDVSFKADFAKYSSRSNKEGFYICASIERVRGQAQGVHLEPQSPAQHLEHIFPKVPKVNEWPKIDDVVHKDYVNRIGNLLVLEGNINKHIKNKSFGYKSDNVRQLCYSKSALKMPKDLYKYLESDQWTVKSIDSRQEDLAVEALSVWSLSV